MFIYCDRISNILYTILLLWVYMIINNKKINNFTKDEFSEDIKYAHTDLLQNLDLLRDFVGCAIFPSPVQGALARFDQKSKDSQHYAKNRLSTAIDVFVNTDPFEAYCKILYSKLFRRVGVYFDTKYRNKPWVMFHLDLKDQDLLWYRDEFGYCYSSERDFYSKLLCKFNQDIVRNM